MALTAMEAYNQFKSDVGGALPSNQMAVKRQVLPEWDDLVEDVKLAWETVMSVNRLDGEAAHTAFSGYMTTSDFDASILSTSRADLVLVDWADLMPQVVTAWDNIAAETPEPPPPEPIVVDPDEVGVCAKRPKKKVTKKKKAKK